MLLAGIVSGHPSPFFIERRKKLTKRKPEKPVVLISPAQLSKRWNVSVQTLRNWRFHRAGPSYVELGDKYAVRYPVSEIIKYETNLCIEKKPG